MTYRRREGNPDPQWWARFLVALAREVVQLWPWV